MRALLPARDGASHEVDDAAAEEALLVGRQLPEVGLDPISAARLGRARQGVETRTQHLA